MDLLTLLIIVGSLSAGILVFATSFEMYNNTRKKSAACVSVPASHNYSPLETSARMVKSVRDGEFLMHILTNEALPFDDDAFLKKYKPYILDPSVVAYIQSIEGEDEYE